MTGKTLSVLLAAAVLLFAAAAAQPVRAPVRTGPVVAVEPVPAVSLQSDLAELTARVAALEAANAQLAERVTMLNEQLATLQDAYGQHRHSFGDNSVAWQDVTAGGQQVSHITGNPAAHDVTGGPHP